MLNALSQTGHFYIIYNSSSSADFTGDGAPRDAFLLHTFTSIFECYKNESISDRHEVNNHILFISVHSFSPAHSLSFYIFVLSLSRSFGLFASSALTDQRRVALCQISDFCWCSEERRTFRGSSGPSARNDL